MISYSYQAQIARAHLLRASNALLVFVEDATCQNMHVRILNRILGRERAIAHVFPLYGRKNVLEAVTKDKGDDPKKIYVIDGDFDVLTGRSVPLFDRLCRLRAYSIENMLFSEQALAGVAEECAVDESLEGILKKLEFEVQWKKLVKELENLFVYYAVVSSLDLPIATVSFNVVRLIEEKDNKIAVTRSAVRSRIKDVRKEVISRVGWKAFRKELRRIRAASRALSDRSLYISGKDYLLPVVHAFLRRNFGLRDSFQGLCVRLAKFVDPDRAPELRDFVRTAEKKAFELSGESN